MSYNLFLDDYRNSNCLGSCLSWITVRNYNEFVKIILERGLPDFISFDHDLSYEHYPSSSNVFEKIDYSKYREKTGYDCALWLIEYCHNKKLPLPKYQIHSMNPVGRENINKLLSKYESHE